MPIPAGFSAVASDSGTTHFTSPVSSRRTGRLSCVDSGTVKTKTNSVPISSGFVVRMKVPPFEMFFV